MIISPPFLPKSGLTPSDDAKTDPMMDAVDKLELDRHGVYPIAVDRRWHCGTHLAPTEQTEAVRAIADGEVVAYRVSQTAISDGKTKRDGSPELNSNNGFVLLKHTTDTGEGRTITFYSLYMHLLDMNAQQLIAPQPIRPPTTGSASALPAWLLHPADGVQMGGNKKVYRKDMLGYWGNCHGHPHLHFEIFMTEEDFGAYFGQTQLGNTAPTTPSSKDYWGHSYYVIPGGQAFVSQPPRLTRSAYFPALEAGTLDVQNKLYVEAYFHRGQRYTRSWIEVAGKLTLLTPQPVADPCHDYEYNLFQRATDLYPSCPSAGYELLRFGRILCAELPPLAAAENQAWVAVTFDDSGAQGYVDISRPAITKLSDADFPFFTGWQKVDEGNTPFSQDGVCDYEELRRIVDIVEASETPVQRKDPAYKQEDQLAAYVYGNDAVRSKLRGFVCHAPSEWDKSSNEARYGRLNQPDGFFGKRKDFDPDGYTNFIKFVEKRQFLDQVPSLSGGKKFWFFHPLAFIRHFRKCAWLVNTELRRMFPPTALRKVSSSQWASEPVHPQMNVVDEFGVELNKAMRKFGIGTALRQAAFLGNAIQETQWFRLLAEGAPQQSRYYPWFGRGFLQLTWPENYIRYWRFGGRQVDQVLADRLRGAARASNQARNNASLVAAEDHVPTDMKEWRRDVARNHFDASDSAGAYWAWSCAAKPADQSPILRRETKQVGNTSRPFYSSEPFGRVAATVNVGHASNNFAAINGLQARYQAYTAALVMLTDRTQFPGADGVLKDFPDW